MTTPTYAEIRAALAATVTSGTGLPCTANRGQVNPPSGLVLPVAGGTFARYSQTEEGAADYMLRVIVFASLADSEGGQDVIDKYAAVGTPESIWAAIRANPKLGGIAADAAVTEAIGYGVMTVNGVDFLKADFIVEVYI